jgi:uncharacterized protein (TIGR01777 family)
MIGTALARSLRERGDEVWIITRRAPQDEYDVQWTASKGIYSPSVLEGLDCVFNLAGAPIADRPWTKGRRQILWDSRVGMTEVLLESLAELQAPPKVLVGTGGIGIFGNRGDDVVGDSEPQGEGFLAHLSAAWESAHLKASESCGCRSAVVRFNMVLSPDGGVFPLMLKPFSYGIGGWLGDGKQYTAWISIRDAVGTLLYVADHSESEGCYNGTVPEPIRNYEWCKALGEVLHKPVLTHAPKWALRGALGELADNLFLASIRAVPDRLLKAGYQFVDEDISETFAWLVAAARGN